MNREEYDELMQDEVKKALDDLFPFHAALPLAQRLKISYAIHNVIRATESLTRDYYLTNLYTVDDLAQKFGVSGRRMRYIAENRHERYGIGMKINGGWVWTADEVEYLRPDEKHRKNSE